MKIRYFCVYSVIKNELLKNDGPVWNSYIALSVKSASIN